MLLNPFPLGGFVLCASLCHDCSLARPSAPFVVPFQLVIATNQDWLAATIIQLLLPLPFVGVTLPVRLGGSCGSQEPSESRAAAVRAPHAPSFHALLLDLVPLPAALLPAAAGE